MTILTQSMEKMQNYTTDSFIINIKTEDFFEDISNDVEKWFDTSNYDKRPLPTEKIKKYLVFLKTN